MITKIKYWLLLVSLITVSTFAQNDDEPVSIGRELVRRKRDLIGWNRTQNTLHQYLRYKNDGDDKKTYANQYKQVIMEMDKEKKQKLAKELKKAIRKKRNRKNRSH